jgi:hypothetical protein
MPPEQQCLPNRRGLSIRPRFTLRLLLIAVTVLCVWLAVHVHRAREQKRIVRLIEINSGKVWYDYEYPGRLDLWGNRLPGESPVPRWLLDRFGVDFFHRARAASIRTPDDLADVCRLDTLQELIVVNSGTNDKDVLQIAGLVRLRVLSIRAGQEYGSERPTRITDQSLVILGQMPRLDTLTAYGDEFSAEGIEALARSDSLSSVTLVGCREDVTHAAAQPFQNAGRVGRLELSRWPYYLPNAWPPQTDVIVSW